MHLTAILRLKMLSRQWGVPHVEVDLILVNSLPLDFSYKLKNADYVSVYPIFESFDIASVTHLRENPLRDLKFVADVILENSPNTCDYVALIRITVLTLVTRKS